LAFGQRGNIRDAIYTRSPGGAGPRAVRAEGYLYLSAINYNLTLGTYLLSRASFAARLALLHNASTGRNLLIVPGKYRYHHMGPFPRRFPVFKQKLHAKPT
jgi:hypothetical protein